jgi:glycosyltransferase involved in cell wall biosynthesis
MARLAANSPAVRIAFASTTLHFPWGGADTLWTHAAEAAQARGDALLISVSPAAAQHPRVAALAAAGAIVETRRQPEADVGLAARLRRKLSPGRRPADLLAASLGRFRPDWVVFNFGGTYDFLQERPAFAWLKASGTPYRIIANWQEEHPRLEEGDRLAAAEALGGAEAVFFVSTRNREITRRHLLAALPNAHVIHNPLRWRPADVSPWPAAPPWSIATVSRLDHGKGIHLLLHAAAQVLGGEPDWRIEIFGRGPGEAYLRETARHLGLAEHLNFRGYVPELREIWRENHLLASPAIDDGVPMTIPEAMLCQRPVLATAVGGAEDWLVPGESGFLCPAPTLPLLAASLRAAWAVRSRWQAMGQAASAQAALTYRPDEYRRLIEPCRRAP